MLWKRFRLQFFSQWKEKCIYTFPSFALKWITRRTELKTKLVRYSAFYIRIAGNTANRFRYLAFDKLFVLACFINQWVVFTCVLIVSKLRFVDKVLNPCLWSESMFFIIHELNNRQLGQSSDSSLWYSIMEEFCW